MTFLHPPDFSSFNVFHINEDIDLKRLFRIVHFIGFPSIFSSLKKHFEVITLFFDGNNIGDLFLLKEGEQGNGVKPSVQTENDYADPKIMDGLYTLFHIIQLRYSFLYRVDGKGQPGILGYDIEGNVGIEGVG